jgi:hypothetical protein
MTNKQDIEDIARCLYTIGKMEHMDIGETAKAAANFAKELLPLFTDRRNSDTYKTALRNLKGRARNVNELIEDRKN